MEILFKKIAIIISSLALFFGGLLGLNNEPDYITQYKEKILSEQQQNQNLGATIPKVVAKFETSLVSGISSSDTSFTLVKGTDAAGNALSGYTCFVIDEGTTLEEFMCGTASSTSITSIIRGIDPIDGDLEVASLKVAHRRGASVKITDHPSLSIALRILNGNETLPNIIKYVSPQTFTASSSLVDKNYVDNIAIAGGVVATESVSGISILSSQSQLPLGTATSSYNSTTYNLIPQNKYFNSTSTATTTVPVTKTNGKLSQGFLDLTESFTLSGGLTSSATTTISGPLTVSAILSNSATSTFTGNVLLQNSNNTIAGTTFTGTQIFNGNLSFATSTTSYTNAVLWQYLGASSTATTATNANATAAIVNMFGASSGCLSEMGGQVTIFKTGLTQSTIYNAECNTVNDSSITASWSGNTITLSKNDGDVGTFTINSGSTIYWYK